MAHATNLYEAKWIKALFGGDFSDIATGATKTITSFEVGLLKNTNAAGDEICPADQTELQDESIVTEPAITDNYSRLSLLNQVSVGGVAGGFKYGPTITAPPTAHPAGSFGGQNGDPARGAVGTLYGTIVNTEQLLFPAATPNGWGDVNYIGLWAVGGPLDGYLVAYVPIDSRPLTVETDNQVNIPQETLVLRLS
jgi:hypothetical protein